LFSAAETEFWKIVGGRRNGAESMPLVDYFRLRKAWGSKERVPSSDVVALKKAEGQYAGAAFDSLYKKWCNGSLKEEEIGTALANHKTAHLPAFRTELCGSSLCVFNARHQTKPENRGDSLTETFEPQISADSSAAESRRCWEKSLRIWTLGGAHPSVGAAQKDASKTHSLLEAIFRLICGQVSIGRTPKKQKNIKIASDGGRKTNREKTVLGR
jgi:hypothetical protein